MRFLHLTLENWRNFLKVDVDLRQRAFFVGPNASGKSNLLDAFRFLRDIADPDGGGLQRAVTQDRRGLAQLRSLHARRHSNVVLEVLMDLEDDVPWTYRLEFNQDYQRKPVVRREIVKRGDEVKLSRPDDDDKADQRRLTQTTLEQVNANRDVRQVVSFFAQIRYLHLVPQLVRRPDSSRKPRDPYGSDFLEQLARTPEKTRKSRLKRIQEALQIAVPQLKELELKRDDATGVPHLRGRYEHWRQNAGWQTEEEFSDGTLRLMGLLWVFLDGSAPLLLEEPELSLHSAVVRHVPRMMAKLGRKVGRQVLVSTHSADMLAEQGIAAEEVICLFPTKEGTEVQVAADDDQVRALLEGGLSMAEAVLPRTAPRNTENLSLFGD